MGQISMKISALPGSVLSENQQIIALRREGLSGDMIVQDTISGGVPALSRPDMASLLQSLMPGDSLIAAKLDRLRYGVSSVKL